ncbi:transposase [Candidatus Kaiserbacteria bacterium]|nr:transposase [Candidatus Kaiserbacteria bacterium]
MGERKVFFQPGEWFHCYNRGVDKRRVFMSPSDYRRFLALMYACNNIEPIHVSDYERGLRSKKLADVLAIARKAPLVDIGAYNLMPNHYHLLLRERIDGGLTSFMRKLGTAYTMYFNIKYERVGALYQGAFKAKHVRTDGYFKRLVNYIHGNHAELTEPKWKEGKVKNETALLKALVAYPHSSLRDYYRDPRPESVIVSTTSLLDVIDAMPRLRDILKDARVFAHLHDGELERSR